MTRRWPLTVLFLSAGLAACGGGDDAPSKKEFAQNANKICRDTQKEFEQIGKSAGNPNEVADAIDKVVDKSKKAADDLVALDRPEGADGKKAEQFTEGFKSDLNSKMVPALEDLQTALRAKDVQGVQKAAQNLQGLEASKTDDYARELGATACVG